MDNPKELFSLLVSNYIDSFSSFYAGNWLNKDNLNIKRSSAEVTLYNLAFLLSLIDSGKKLSYNM